MKIAIISDVHGNYPALVNVVKDAKTNSVDKFIFIGDYIFDLPFSNEVTQLLMKIENSHIIKGNKETYLNELADDTLEKWKNKQFAGLIQTYNELAPDSIQFLSSLEDELFIQINPSTSIFAAHIPTFVKQLKKENASSSTYRRKMYEKPFTHDQFLQNFSDSINSDECKSYINKIDANIYLFGHNHLQCFGYCGDKLVVNPGSCGQPLDFNNNAAYTILEINGTDISVHEKRVPYNVELTINQARNSVLYEKAPTWSLVTFVSLKTGIDHFGIFFEIANQIAVSKGEEENVFSDSTWEEASEEFVKKFAKQFPDILKGTKVL